MADYYPLIARALESLSDKSPDTRRAVYERARAALTEQLRTLRPPLPEADILRERQALDDAIARIEAEQAAKPDRPVPRPSAVPRPAPASRPQPALRPEPSPRPPAAAPPAPAPQPAPAPPPASVLARAHPESTPAARQRVTEPAPFEPAREPIPARDTVPARDAFPAQQASSARELFPAREGSPAQRSFEAYLPEAAAPIEPPEFEPAPEPPARPRVQTRGPVVQQDNRIRSIIVIASVLTIVLLIAGLAVYWKVDPETQLRQQADAGASPSQTAEGQPKFGERVGGGPVIAPPSAVQPAGRTDVSVAQRAVFYEEDPADPQNPKATAGRVTWRLETVNAGQGQPLQTAVRAVVEVPDANFALNVLIRRNLDETLPASHTIELAFSTPPGEPNRMTRDVGLLQFKNEEAARGTPVAGLQVPVRDNLFLIGLSNLTPNIERNLNLLLRHNWIDLPIRLASGQRAIVSFEKGVAGERVLNEASRQWQ